MKTHNDIEDDINRIRLEIYEETKHMTPAQYVEYFKKSAEDCVKECGYMFVIGPDNRRRLKKIQTTSASI